ncbi:MAG: hypothetical protein KDI50_07760, partial [Candidatus Competibacteraceae bacterium]|nr:hypothetical protein [Candidatus Competibacteraceae bacterium]
MNSLPRNAEHPAKKRPLHRQLLLSHLSVALVGISLLLAALVSTYELRNRIVLLAREGAPMAQASLRVLAGVQHSLASLRGWVSLGDPHFLEGWRIAWDQDILPAITVIKQCRRMFEQTCILKRLPELEKHLTQLQESQNWVKDIAHTPDNEPARLIYQVEIASNAIKLRTRLTALQHEEEAQDDAPGRKALLARIMKIQNVVFKTQLLLSEILDVNG